MQDEFKPSRFWRIISGVWIGLAVFLILGGQTWWKEEISGLGFIIYWGACFVCAFFAAVCALLDLSTIRRETRIEHRKLFHETLEKIQVSAAESKHNKNDDPSSPASSES